MARNKVQFQKGLSLSDFLNAMVPKSNALRHCSPGDGQKDFAAPIAIMTSPANLLTESFSNAIAVITKPR